MQQQNKLQDNQNTAIVQANEPRTLTDITKLRIMDKYGITEQAWAILDAEVSIGLLTLRTAFPTQARNYSDREHDMLTALWLEIFAEVERGILNEAIMRFVAADRKGFFPSPGQVMGFVEEIIKEREKRAKEESMKIHAAYLRQLQQRIDNGENCSTCRFCITREVKHFWNKANEAEQGLFCQNPESYKYEGEHGYGTAASILCDLYEPKNENGVIENE
jgi:hypothetical protein